MLTRWICGLIQSGVSHAFMATSHDRLLERNDLLVLHAAAAAATTALYIISCSLHAVPRQVHYL